MKTKTTTTNMNFDIAVSMAFFINELNLYVVELLSAYK
jgi:hypothetical protein